jgi:hypothetical protein
MNRRVREIGGKRPQLDLELGDVGEPLRHAGDEDADAELRRETP